MDSGQAQVKHFQALVRRKSFSDYVNDKDIRVLWLEFMQQLTKYLPLTTVINWREEHHRQEIIFEFDFPVFPKPQTKEKSFGGPGDLFVFPSYAINRVRLCYAARIEIIASMLKKDVEGLAELITCKTMDTLLRDMIFDRSAHDEKKLKIILCQE